MIICQDVKSDLKGTFLVGFFCVIINLCKTTSISSGKKCAPMFRTKMLRSNSEIIAQPRIHFFKHINPYHFVSLFSKQRKSHYSPVSVGPLSKKLDQVPHLITLQHKQKLNSKETAQSYQQKEEGFLAKQLK